MKANTSQKFDFQLIQGQFTAQDALEIITRMVQAKILYHESKISSLENEEDIKSRESRIKQLQKDLYEIRQYISAHGDGIAMRAHVELS